MAFAITEKATFGIDRHSATEAISEILHAYFGDTYKLEIEAVFEPVAAMLAGSLTRKIATLGISEAVSESNVEAFFSFMKNVLSLEAAIAFGGMIIHAILLANRLGMYARIRKSLRIVEDIVDRNIASNRTFEKGTNPLDVYSEAEIESIQQQWKSIGMGRTFARF